MLSPLTRDHVETSHPDTAVHANRQRIGGRRQEGSDG